MTLGIVTEYECREAARFSGRSWEQWLAIEDQDDSGIERALSVAHYRSHNALEANISDAQQQHMEAESRRNRRRGRR